MYTDGGVSSTAANHQSEARRAAPQPVEDTPNQVPDRSEPVIEGGATSSPPYSAIDFREGGASGKDTPTPPLVGADSGFEEPPPLLGVVTVAVTTTSPCLVTTEEGGWPTMNKLELEFKIWCWMLCLRSGQIGCATI